jgi:hypothetical protein
MKTTEQILEMYLPQCPTLKIADGKDTCRKCVHHEGCQEVDACNLHHLCHDWDQAESLNFVNFVCNDFVSRDGTPPGNSMTDSDSTATPVDRHCYAPRVSPTY